MSISRGHSKYRLKSTTLAKWNNWNLVLGYFTIMIDKFQMVLGTFCLKFCENAQKSFFFFFFFFLKKKKPNTHIYSYRFSHFNVTKYFYCNICFFDLFIKQLFGSCKIIIKCCICVQVQIFNYITICQIIGHLNWTP